MKKLFLIITLLVSLSGCTKSKKETMQALKENVKKDDVCKVIKLTEEIIKAFYPSQKVIFTLETIQKLGCKNE